MKKNANFEGKPAVNALKLNFKTISILDDVALQNIKGGRALDAEEPSCTSGFCKNSCKGETTEVLS